MIVIAQQRRAVTAESIQPNRHRPIRLRQPENRVPIERVSNRPILPQDRLQMQRRRMVMVVVRPPTMPTPLIQFPYLRRNLPTIILRIENRNSIRRQGNRPAKEPILDRGGLFRWHRDQRNLPGISTSILLRKRHLLLPCRDTHHHLVRRQPVALDKKKARVPAQSHPRSECRKHCRLHWPLRHDSTPIRQPTRRLHEK